MRSLKTKRFGARIADPTLFGPPASSNFSPQKTSPTSPSAVLLAELKSAPTASASLVRARDYLRDVLIREDVTEEIFLLDEVRNELEFMCHTLDALAGKQMLFELWSTRR